MGKVCFNPTVLDLVFVLGSVAGAISVVYLLVTGRKRQALAAMRRQGPQMAMIADGLETPTDGRSQARGSSGHRPHVDISVADREDTNPRQSRNQVLASRSSMDM